MNEKDLVTFEQAKKLKELGFDWECLYHYYEGYLESNGCRYDAQDVDSAYDSLNTTDWNPLEWIDAPFLYQVQNWLREEKNIHLVVSFDYREKKWFWLLKKLNDSFVAGDSLIELYYNSYYEALNAGIDKALESL